MRVDNLKWHPVRLSLTRNASHSWHVSRDGQLVGSVAVVDGQWHSTRVGRDPSSYSRTSFRTAVLFLTRADRLYGVCGSSSPQDYGLVHMLRVNVSGQWFTVIRDSVAGGDARYVYEDFTIPDEMTDRRQANMRKVHTVVRRWEASR